VIARRFTTATLVALCLWSMACGKRGDPLAPLRLVPASMGEFSARRAAQQVELRFTLPTANANGPGPVDLDHVEIYAVTVGAGAVPPPNRDLLTKARLVGAVPVKPPAVEGGPQPSPDDKRPAPGDAVTFVEELTEAKLTPIPAPAEKAGADTAGADKAVQIRQVQIRQVQIRQVQIRQVQIRRVQTRRVQRRQVQIKQVQLRQVHLPVCPAHLPWPPPRSRWRG
jgi:hypothetical protein